jgi:uncharacterized membrane protein YdjX (TVP38/TMEM64 family)
VSSGKLLLLFAIAAAVGLFFALDLGHYLSLDWLKAQQAAIAAYRADHPLAAVAAYFALYVAVTALSLPGAALMTLAGGAVFGLLWGTLIVSFASSIGATLAFLASRFLLRDWVMARFGRRLAAIDAGVRKEGAFYLFTLRLVPVFPSSSSICARPHGDAGADLLLGEPARHAGRHGGVRERRHAAGADRFAAGILSPGLIAPSCCSAFSR